MARLVVVCAAVLLMVVALATGQQDEIIQQVMANTFPPGSLPNPVRIYSRGNTAVNVAVRNNAVVLANSDSTDRKQLWYLAFQPTTASGFRPFSLVNADTLQVVLIPTQSGQKLTLTETFDLASTRTQLWTPGMVFTYDGFYEIKVTGSDTSLTLNALGGAVQDGTQVGVYTWTPSADNTLWNLTSAVPKELRIP